MVVVTSMECDWMWLFISIKRWSNWYPTKTACCPKWPNATWQLLHLFFLNPSMVETPKTNLCTSFSGWWFQPLWKILVNWDNYFQYMEKKEKYKMFQTTNQFWSQETDSLWRAERGLYTELAKWGWQPAESESEWHHNTIQKHPTVTGSFEKHPSWVEKVWCRNVGFTKINTWMYTLHTLFAELHVSNAR